MGALDPFPLPDAAKQGIAKKQMMTKRQKAAVIVRLLLSEETDPGIRSLPAYMQEQIARDMSEMRFINKDALQLIVAEFTHQLENIGIYFPHGLSGALSLLEGHLSPNTADLLRDESGAEIQGNPWERLAGLDASRLTPIVREESIEVCAVLMSKLSVPKAAELLGSIDPDRARKIAYAVSLTGDIDPETVARIGAALGRRLDAQPARAFKQGPIERVGAILNASTAQSRSRIIEGLDEEDAQFASEVRKAIFTYANIKARISTRDMAKLPRATDPVTFTKALAFGQTSDPEVTEHILANISPRLADQIRDEIGELGPVTASDGEQAQNTLITAIREMETAGEIMLLSGVESSL